MLMMRVFLKRVPFPENRAFCIAPWTHTYLSPQSERRLCCASHEKAQFTQQYIDQRGEISSYKPKSLEEHWNGDFMRGIRRQMLQGIQPDECKICNEQILNLHTYKRYFNETMFPHHLDKAFKNTDDEGYTTLKPISFDYRFSNICDFKCRMCGPQLSSAWEAETLRNVDRGFTIEEWMRPEIKRQISHFHKQVVEVEFLRAIERGEVEEIYWVGGEPTMWPIHWSSMQRLIQDGNAHKVFVRYNTNLNHIVHKGVHLFDDLLPHFKGYNVCASIDAAGKIGEFLRTGFQWHTWIENFKSGLKHRQPGQMDSLVFDLTLTLPGLFGLKELFDTACELNIKMYVKIVFDFDPSKILSPFALPKDVLHDLLDDLIDYIRPRLTDGTKDLLQTLIHMKTKPTFEEKYPASWQHGFMIGKEFLKNLAEIRNDGKMGRLTIEDIYSLHPGVKDWWEKDYS